MPSPNCSLHWFTPPCALCCRLEALYRLGGVYLDTDFECVRPLDDLIARVDFLARRS